MLEALTDAFAVVISAKHMTFLAIGVAMGLAVGVFPGLGGIAGLSLMLPFLYGLDPISGLAMMVGLVAVIPTSDTFTSVLMGIPGSSSAQATVLDGFPLGRPANHLAFSYARIVDADHSRRLDDRGAGRAQHDERPRRHRTRPHHGRDRRRAGTGLDAHG